MFYSNILVFTYVALRLQVPSLSQELRGAARRLLTDFRLVTQGKIKQAPKRDLYRV